MDLQYNFFKSIISHPGIDGRVDHRNKIPKGFRRKKSPEIYRHGNGHRKFPEHPVLLLLLQKRIKKHGIQIFRNRHLICSRR